MHFDPKTISEYDMEDLLSVYWQMMKKIESSTDPVANWMDAAVVVGAYNVLNRIGLSSHRPRWEEKSPAPLDNS